MSSREFSLWLHMSKTDPWDEHMDLGFGVVAATVAEYAGKTRKDTAPPVVPADFMRTLPRPVEVESILLEPDPVAFFKGM